MWFDAYDTTPSNFWTHYVKMRPCVVFFKILIL
jgi:hypothetical protein